MPINFGSFYIIKILHGGSFSSETGIATAKFSAFTVNQKTREHEFPKAHNHISRKHDTFSVNFIQKQTANLFQPPLVYPPSSSFSDKTSTMDPCFCVALESTIILKLVLNSRFPEAACMHTLPMLFKYAPVLADPTILPA